MRRTIRGLSLLMVVLVAACLAAGCGGAVQSAVSGLSTSSLPSDAATGSTAPDQTAAPTPTAAPSTAAPSTATTTVTAAPSTATTTVTAAPSTATTTVTASATAAPSPSAAASGGGTSLIWLWVLLGVLALAGLITWIVLSGRRRSATAAGWQSRLIDAYAKGSALHDAMSVAEVQGNLAADDARARWYDIQRRADDLAQTLYTLRESASDPADQARIADALASLQAVRSAMDAERAPGGASAEQADVVRSRLYSFELSLRALRAGGQQFS